MSISIASLFGRDPLWWAGISGDNTIIVSGIMAFGCAIAATGERINGRWRWSPLLRAIGLLIMGGVMGIVAIEGLDISVSAWANYSALWFLLWAGSAMALTDLMGDVRHAGLAGDRG